jgi:hypothetical protein
VGDGVQGNSSANLLDLDPIPTPALPSKGSGRWVRQPHLLVHFFTSSLFPSPFHLKKPHNPAGVHPMSRPMKKFLLLLLATMCCGVVVAAEPARFIGKVVVEWLDDDPFIPSMRLVENFGFQDASGKTWMVDKGATLDGRSLPLLFRDMFGVAFLGSYRKTSVLYDHYCRTLSAPWRDVQRLFYNASLAEGVDEGEAKLMYMALYAAGMRWEMKSSSCFSHCHASAPSLTWKPDIHDLDLKPVQAWILQAAPNVDAIDARLDALIKRPGPHVFEQGR